MQSYYEQGGSNAHAAGGASFVHPPSSTRTINTAPNQDAKIEDSLVAEVKSHFHYHGHHGQLQQPNDDSHQPREFPLLVPSLSQLPFSLTSASLPAPSVKSKSERKEHSSTTWTDSSGDPTLFTDLDEAEDRAPIIGEYNRLARKHGIRLLVPDDYSTPTVDPEIRKRSWFTRTFCRPGSSCRSHSGKSEKSILRKRSVSDMLVPHNTRRDSLKDEDLQSLVRLCGRSILYLPSDYAPGPLTLPTCFRATAQFLVQHAPETRGVFRIPGSTRVVNSLYEHYCADLGGEYGDEVITGTVRSPNLPTHIKASIHDVASTFKRLLGGLPGGVLGQLSLFDALVAIHSQLRGDPEFNRTKRSKLRARLIALAIGTLASQYRRELICAVFGLLCLIGRTAEVAPREDATGKPLPTSDLMGYSALGIVFGPLLVGDLIDSYSMKLADPGAGLVLFPATTAASGTSDNKHRRRSWGKSSASESRRPVTPMRVDKILVANSIAEMLITHWRDAVKHMRSLGILRRHSTVGQPNIREARSWHRPVTADVFVPKRPAGMNSPVSHRSTVGVDTSPGPRSIASRGERMGNLHVESEAEGGVRAAIRGLEAEAESLVVKKQRSRADTGASATSSKQPQPPLPTAGSNETPLSFVQPNYARPARTASNDTRVEQRPLLMEQLAEFMPHRTGTPGQGATYDESMIHPALRSPGPRPQMHARQDTFGEMDWTKANGKGQKTTCKEDTGVVHRTLTPRNHESNSNTHALLHPSQSPVKTQGSPLRYQHGPEQDCRQDAGHNNNIPDYTAQPEVIPWPLLNSTTQDEDSASSIASEHSAVTEDNAIIHSPVAKRLSKASLADILDQKVQPRQSRSADSMRTRRLQARSSEKGRGSNTPSARVPRTPKTTPRPGGGLSRDSSGRWMPVVRHHADISSQTDMTSAVAFGDVTHKATETSPWRSSYTDSPAQVNERQLVKSRPTPRSRRTDGSSKAESMSPRSEVSNATVETPASRRRKVEQRSVATDTHINTPGSGSAIPIPKTPRSRPQVPERASSVSHQYQNQPPSLPPDNRRSDDAMSTLQRLRSQTATTPRKQLWEPDMTPVSQRSSVRNSVKAMAAMLDHAATASTSDSLPGTPTLREDVDKGKGRGGITPHHTNSPALLANYTRNSSPTKSVRSTKSNLSERDDSMPNAKTIRREMRRSRRSARNSTSEEGTTALHASPSLIPQPSKTYRGRLSRSPPAIASSPFIPPPAPPLPPISASSPMRAAKPHLENKPTADQVRQHPLMQKAMSSSPSPAPIQFPFPPQPTRLKSHNLRSPPPPIPPAATDPEGPFLPSLGRMVPPPSQPPIARHLIFARPASFSRPRPGNLDIDQTAPGTLAPAPVLAYSSQVPRTQSPHVGAGQGAGTGAVGPTGLHAQIRVLQRALDTKTDECTSLKAQLGAVMGAAGMGDPPTTSAAGAASPGAQGRGAQQQAQGGGFLELASGDRVSSMRAGAAGTLSQLLREAQREVLMWKGRAEAAEKRVVALEGFVARMREGRRESSGAGMLGSKGGGDRGSDVEGVVLAGVMKRQEESRGSVDGAGDSSAHTEDGDVFQNRMMRKLAEIGMGGDGCFDRIGHGALKENVFDGDDADDHGSIGTTVVREVNGFDVDDEESRYERRLWSGVPLEESLLCGQGIHS